VLTMGIENKTIHWHDRNLNIVECSCVMCLFAAPLIVYRNKGVECEISARTKDTRTVVRLKGLTPAVLQLEEEWITIIRDGAYPQLLCICHT